MLESPNQIGFIIPDKGFILGTVGPVWYDPRPTAYEQLLYVSPPARHGTIPLRLLRAFEKEAIDRGAYQIKAGSSLGYKPESVVKLYERLGYEHTSYGVTKLCAIQAQ